MNTLPLTYGKADSDIQESLTEEIIESIGRQERGRETYAEG
jgi:hypothetical protein